MSSLEMKTRKMMDECEGFMNTAFKLSGVSTMDALLGLNVETGAALGEAMNLYKQAKDLVIEQASAMDKMRNDLEELKRMNERLMRQNCDLLEITRGMIKVSETTTEIQAEILKEVTSLKKEDSEDKKKTK